MTVPPTPKTPPPAWYPAPDGSGRQQWWDGSAWTGHFNAPYRPAAPVARPQLHDGAPVYGPFIWLVTLLPLVPVLFLLAWNPSLHFHYVGLRQVRTMDPASVFTPAYFLTFFSGWLVLAVCALLAFLDWQHLRRIGVVRPFHWAWVFLNPAVYVVGRSIIVHQVAQRRGLAPVWALIGVYAVIFLATSLKFAALLASVAETVST